MKHPKPTKAFSLIELAVVVLLIGLVTIVAVNGKSLLVKANCVASSFGTKTVTDNLDNSAALTANKNTAYETCVNSAMGIATVNTNTGLCSGSPCTSCKAILDNNPGITSKTYTIDPDGAGTGLSPFTAYCDMTTDGGGWTLVLNYLHKGGQDRNLYVRTTNLPVIGSMTLGTDESLPTPTTSIYWGHAGNALLNKFTFTDLRFYGKTSGHGRVINFKTSLSNCLSYFKTGIGSCAGLTTNFTPIPGHSSHIPAENDSTYTDNRGDLAMTSFPLCKSGSYHWGFNDSGRWEVDDYANGPQNDTHHQIWIR